MFCVHRTHQDSAITNRLRADASTNRERWFLKSGIWIKRKLLAFCFQASMHECWTTHALVNEIGSYLGCSSSLWVVCKVSALALAIEHDVVIQHAQLRIAFEGMGGLEKRMAWYAGVWRLGRWNIAVDDVPKYVAALPSAIDFEQRRICDGGLPRLFTLSYVNRFSVEEKLMSLFAVLPMNRNFVSRQLLTTVRPIAKNNESGQ